MTTHKSALRKSPENDERFRGLVGAWDDEEPLPETMRDFAAALPTDYRGWAEVIRGWAYRIEREAEEEASRPHHTDADGEMCAEGCPVWDYHQREWDESHAAR